jgi:hypothetical protein
VRVVKLPDRFSTLKDRFEAIVFREMAENHVNDHDRLLEMMSPRFGKSSPKAVLRMPSFTRKRSTKSRISTAPSDVLLNSISL